MGICRCTQRACERQGPEKRAGLHSTTETSTTVSKNKGRTGVTNLSKNCTCGLSTGISSNCGTSTVVCSDTTVIDVTCLSQATERLTDCTCGIPLHSDHLVEVHPSARVRLPRQSATAKGATTPGFSGPFPLHSGVFGTPPFFVRCSPRWFESTPSGCSLGLVLFGLPAREF